MPRTLMAMLGALILTGAAWCAGAGTAALTGALTPSLAAEAASAEGFPIAPPRGAALSADALAPSVSMPAPYLPKSWWLNYVTRGGPAQVYRYYAPRLAALGYTLLGTDTRCLPAGPCGPFWMFRSGPDKNFVLTTVRLHGGRTLFSVSLTELLRPRRAPAIAVPGDVRWAVVEVQSTPVAPAVVRTVTSPAALERLRRAAGALRGGEIRFGLVPFAQVGFAAVSFGTSSRDYVFTVAPNDTATGPLGNPLNDPHNRLWAAVQRVAGANP